MFKKIDTLLFIIVLGCTATALFYYGYYDQIWEGGADGYWHYFISKYAPENTHLFINHWGKPIFTLLSSPFSQFGFYGLIVFNILCGIGSAVVTFLFCQTLGFRATWLSAIVLLFNALYFFVLQSGMTEPLFSLLFILSAYLLYNEKYLAGALIASFLIYSRSEGMFFIILFAGYLLLNRQWKYVPLLASAFIVYSFVGYFSGHDFLWYFTENPYALNSVYGHGTWFHFFEKYSIIFGNTHTWLLLVGILLLILSLGSTKDYYLFKRPMGKHLKVTLLVFVPSLAFFLFHVYAWAEGKFASAGLERVMACILPGTAILSMYPVNLLNKLKVNKVILFALNVFLANKLIADTFNTYSFPLQAWGPEKAEREAGEWLKKVREPNTQLFYAHPGIVFFTDENPYSLANRESNLLDLNCEFKGLQHFYYVWDSHFSEGAFGQKLETLKTCEKLKLLASFGEDRADAFRVHVFEYKPKK